jgi:hypothetical protein
VNIIIVFERASDGRSGRDISLDRGDAGISSMSVHFVVSGQAQTPRRNRLSGWSRYLYSEKSISCLVAIFFFFSEQL